MLYNQGFLPNPFFTFDECIKQTLNTNFSIFYKCSASLLLFRFKIKSLRLAYAASINQTMNLYLLHVNTRCGNLDLLTPMTLETRWTVWSFPPVTFSVDRPISVCDGRSSVNLSVSSMVCCPSVWQRSRATTGFVFNWCLVTEPCSMSSKDFGLKLAATSDLIWS